jgi:hypothetical protein
MIDQESSQLTMTTTADPFNHCTTNHKSKNKTSCYAWTVSPKDSSKIILNNVVKACALEDVQGMVYYIEEHKKGGQHIHGIAHMGHSGRADKKSLETLEANLNSKHSSIQFKLRRCWDVPGWAAYIQKDGGFEHVYPQDSTQRWWSKYRINLPTKGHTQDALKEAKKENAKDIIIFTALKEWFDERKVFIDLGSMMCYTPTDKPGVYREVVNTKQKHCGAFDIIQSVLAEYNLVSIKQIESTTTAIVNILKGWTIGDVIKGTFNEDTPSTGISNVMQSYCITLQHLCVRFHDFAIEAPHKNLITGPALKDINTVHYCDYINLDNRIEMAEKFKDSDPPVVEILKLNKQFNKELLSTLYEAMGQRLGPKHKAIHNSGVSNGAKSTICEYPKSYYPRKAYGILSKDVEGEFSLSPFVNFIRLFIEEGERFLAKGGPATKIILEGGDLDVPMKGKNFSKEINNEHVTWINSNITKDSDEWLYDSAKMNRLFNIVYSHAFTGGHSKDNADIKDRIHSEKYDAMNFFFEANRLYKDKDETTWPDVPLNDIPQQEKRDMLIKMYQDWYSTKLSTLVYDGQ